MKLNSLLKWSCLLSFLLFCSCGSPQKDAQRKLARELELRRENEARSMRLYEQGIGAQKASGARDAKQYFSESLRFDGANVYAWMALGSCRFDEEDYYAAAEAFHQAAKLLPWRYEPHFNLGTVFESVGRFSDAIQAYETALRLQPDQLQTMENLARAYIRANQNPQRAKELVDRALFSEERPQWRRWLQLQSLRLTPTTRPADSPRGEP